MPMKAAGRSVGRRRDVARLTAELAASEARFRALADSLVESVYEAVLDDPAHPSGVYTFWSGNVQAMLGYPPEDFFADDRLWEKRLHPEDRDWVLQRTRQLFQSGDSMD